MGGPYVVAVSNESMCLVKVVESFLLVAVSQYLSQHKNAFFERPQSCSTFVCHSSHIGNPNYLFNSIFRFLGLLIAAMPCALHGVHCLSIRAAPIIVGSTTIP
jgi:hypothetical protein